MRTYLYDCTTQDKRLTSHKALGKELAKVPDGYEYVLTLKKNKAIRSLGQNNFFHMVLTIYANHIGLYLDEMKGEFYDAIGFYEMHEDKRGSMHKRYRSSADLDQGEMSALITKFLQWAGNAFPEVKVPRKEDATYKQWLEVENEYQKALAGW